MPAPGEEGPIEAVGVEDGHVDRQINAAVVSSPATSAHATSGHACKPPGASTHVSVTVTAARASTVAMNVCLDDDEEGKEVEI